MFAFFAAMILVSAPVPLGPIGVLNWVGVGPRGLAVRGYKSPLPDTLEGYRLHISPFHTPPWGRPPWSWAQTGRWGRRGSSPSCHRLGDEICIWFTHSVAFSFLTCWFTAILIGAPVRGFVLSIRHGQIIVPPTGSFLVIAQTNYGIST